MDQVRFIRGTSAQIENQQSLVEGGFYYATDTNELSMAMGGQLISLDNSIYWFEGQTPQDTPAQQKKRLAYGFDTEVLYIAVDNEWKEVSRKASISNGALNL